MRTMKARTGLATVEAAIVFPLLVLLTMGLIEYGWMFLKAQQTTHAARRGARVAVRADGTNEEVQAAISSLMESAGMGSSGYVVSITPGDVSAIPATETVTVQVSVPYTNVTLAGTPIVPVPSTLNASVTMAKEGP